MASYIQIENMSVRGFQAMQTLNLITPLPLFPACMFAHALASKLGVKDDGVALVIHDARVRAEAMPNKQFIETTLHGQRGGNCYSIGKSKAGGDYADPKGKPLAPQAMSGQPQASADGVFSLVIRVDGDVGTKEKVLSQIGKMRFAGGRIDNTPYVVITDTLPEWLPPAGRVVQSASEDVQRQLNSGKDIVESVFGRETAKGDAEVPRITLPATVGYAAISDFKPRDGARIGPSGEDLAVAPAEAMVGLFHLVNTRHVHLHEQSVFWNLEWGRESSCAAPFDYCHLIQSPKQTSLSE